MLDTIIYSLLFISIVISSGFAIFYMFKNPSLNTPSTSIQNSDYSTQQMYSSYTLPHNQPYICNNTEQYIIRHGPRIYTELPLHTNFRKIRKNVKSLFVPTEDEIKNNGLHYKIK